MTDSVDQIIGSIGLGLMDKPMAGSLQRAANQVFVGLSMGAVAQVLLQ